MINELITLNDAFMSSKHVNEHKNELEYDR